MDRTEKKDFSRVLFDHLYANKGEPEDQDIANWWAEAAQTLYGCQADDPEFAKWVVQESPKGTRELSFHRFEERGPYITIEGRETEVHFIGRMLDGTVFASTSENGSPLTLIPNQEDVMEGFSLAVSSMQEGEKAMFTIPDKLSLTKSGCPASIPWNIPPNETLWFDIELISFTTDILGDQGIMKKTTKIGAGEQHPCDLDEVFVKYNVWLKDGTLVSESEGVEFSLAEGFFCPAFAHALKTMSEGEEVFLVVKPQYGFGECGRPSMGNEISVPPDSTLHVNLRLISWKTVTHIGENGEIVKTTFSRAKFGGCHAREGDYMKVRLIGKLQDGTIFDRRGHDGQEPAVFSRDKETDCAEKFVAGLKEALMTMVEGDIASVTIPPQHAFGTVGSNEYQLAVVPPDSVITYEIELLSVEKSQGGFQLYSFSRRKMKQDRERRERLMGVPPAAKLQENASQPPIPAAPEVVLVGGQSPATPETPAAGAGSVTTTS